MEKTPQCIGIILDGNRRWATAKGLPKLEGHRAGLEALKVAVRSVAEAGIEHVVVYAFSTENWNREKEEVGYLMDLFLEMAKKDTRELGKEGVRTRFVGQRERFSTELQKVMEEVEVETESNTRVTLWVCLSYGGRAEIAHAAAEAALEGAVTEESIAKHLWTAGMPDPELIVRTSGEQRLSNFLLWQGAYSELFFIDTMWPDFTKETLEKVLIEYQLRQRRLGR